MTRNQVRNLAALSDYRYKLNNLPEHWQRDINLKRTIKTGEQVKYYIPYCNVLYYYIGREFTEQIGPEYSVHKHICMFTGRQLNDVDRFDLPSIYIHTSVSNISKDVILQFTVRGLRGLEYGEQTYNLHPPGNMPITDNNVTDYIFNWVQANIFFKTGNYQDLQILNVCTKQWLIDRLKNRNKTLLSYDPTDIKQWLKRHYKLDFDTWNDYDIDTACKIAAKLGKQDTLKQPCSLDMSFMYDFDGDLSEAEGVLYDAMSDYPDNAIFIN